ncbi:hypothetical protein [Nocardia sp. NPDC059239]|uniref:hypothetical protein n=1 Tax=Nocardia sp. NPDC059239 TaxID=3346785 RepID=UPI003675C762
MFYSTVDLLAEAVQEADWVCVQTNSWPLPEEEAVALVGRIKADGEAAAESLGDKVRFVLRGGSKLRWHIFAESQVFLDNDVCIQFVPRVLGGGA